MSILINRHTKVICQGITGAQGEGGADVRIEITHKSTYYVEICGG
jgi:succinyl-CoA synthetase alpha subunit